VKIKLKNANVSKRKIKNNRHFHICYIKKTDIMGCGASNDTSRVQAPALNKKSVLPPIDSHLKKKSPSAKSNGSNDSGIEDSEPIRSKFKFL
jgi:hypothetical protein